MTLWILFCRMTNEVDTLFTFYAKDRQHAELKAGELLDWYGYERLDLKEYRSGFRMVWTHIPGRIEIDNQQHNGHFLPSQRVLPHVGG